MWCWGTSVACFCLQSSPMINSSWHTCIAPCSSPQQASHTNSLSCLHHSPNLCTHVEVQHSVCMHLHDQSTPATATYTHAVCACKQQQQLTQHSAPDLPGATGHVYFKKTTCCGEGSQHCRLRPASAAQLAVVLCATNTAQDAQDSCTSTYSSHIILLWSGSRPNAAKSTCCSAQPTPLHHTTA